MTHDLRLNQCEHGEDIQIHERKSEGTNMSAVKMRSDCKGIWTARNYFVL